MGPPYRSRFRPHITSIALLAVAFILTVFVLPFLSLFSKAIFEAFRFFVGRILDVLLKRLAVWVGRLGRFSLSLSLHENDGKGSPG